MNCSTAAIIVIVAMALFVAIALWINHRLLKRHYKSKVVQMGTHRYKILFCYLCGCSEDSWWDWCQLYYRENPLKFSPISEHKYKAAIFKTYEEAVRVKALYDEYIVNYGGIEDD